VRWLFLRDMDVAQHKTPVTIVVFSHVSVTAHRVERILPFDEFGTARLRGIVSIMSSARESTLEEKAPDATYVPVNAASARASEHLPKRGKSLVSWLVGFGLAGDVFAIVGGLLLAFWVRFDTPVRYLGRTVSAMTLPEYRGHFVFLGATLLLLLFHFGLYSPTHVQRLRKINAVILTSCTAFYLANLGLSFQLNTQPIVSRVYLLVAFALTFLALLAWRWLYDRLLRISSIAAVLQRRIMLVGWTDQSAKLVENVLNDSRHPYQIIGAVPSSSGNFEIDPPAKIERLGEYRELRELFASHAIDIVVVSDLNPTRGELVDLVTLCEKEGVHLQVIPSCFQILVSGLHLETTSGVPVLGISRLPLDSPWNQLLKRTVDIVGALVGLIISAPIIAVFGAIVYLESPGPIFYRQRRLGCNNQSFYIVKIRSMRLDAEHHGKPGWTTKDDPRRLRIGKLMRSWNIDEVPQFWNVLKGEMSLVGPRPERPELIENFKEQIPHYNARHGIKPGITGWAQVNGLRGDTDLVERIKCDLYYIENWNILLEFQIFLMTLFQQKNAC
jgi:exopolysaccharide biosynthesis polyprenyl glycosylphosphotransferase